MVVKLTVIRPWGRRPLYPLGRLSDARDRVWWLQETVLQTYLLGIYVDKALYYKCLNSRAFGCVGYIFIYVGIVCLGGQKLDVCHGRGH